MDVPFFDLRRQYQQLRDDIDDAVGDVLATQHCIGGPYVERLEERLAQRVGTEHAIGVSSGSDALLVSLMALDIGPGDEVVTTPFTFFSPVEAILRLGARPVFVDIDPATFNLDASRLEAAITERTRAILPVHLFGQTCDMTSICDVADAHDLAVVEDMAQAIDARHQNRGAGSWGTTGCVSFYPTKNLGGAGDGGMVFCDDSQLAARIRRLGRHGAQPKYHHLEVGGNFRLDAIQAAILNVKLEHLDRWTKRRRHHAAAYDAAFESLPNVAVPTVAEANESVYNQYTIKVSDRARLIDELDGCGVGTNIYYPEPLHTQPALDDCQVGAGDFPVAEQICEQVVSLPVFPELTDDERRRVEDAVVECSSS